MVINRLGILGAGRAGTALARVCAQAGIDVQLASTRPPRAMKYHLAQYAPAAVAVSAEDIAVNVDAVVLAVPQEDLLEVDPSWVSDVLRIDMTNRWENEPVPDWLASAPSSSEGVATYFGPVVKAFNHLSHWDLDSASPSRALGIAADSAHDAAVVAGLVERLGFVPVVLKSLAAGSCLEPGGPIFNQVLDADQLLVRCRGFPQV